MQVLRKILGLRSVEGSLDELKTAPLERSTPSGGNADGNNKKTAPVDGGGVTKPLNQLSPDGSTRQLTPLDDALDQVESVGSRFVVGQKSDVGQVRDNNQDAISTFVSTIESSEGKPEFGLFVVADGMGGHEDGEKASGFAARIVTKQIINDIYVPMLGDNFGNDSDQKPVTEMMKTSVQEANEYISSHVPDGGTTVTAIAIIGNLAYLAHVGDSRAYMVTRDGIEQLTRDHSLVQRLIELGNLTPEEALEHPQRNVLYRAIGQGDMLDVDALTRQIVPGSYLMLCSDGLWNLVSDDEILTNILSHGNNTQMACQKLVDLANERGGTDNISIILVKIPEV